MHVPRRKKRRPILCEIPALKLAKDNPNKEQTLIVNLSGRGDKDIFQVYDHLHSMGLLKDGHLTMQDFEKFKENSFQPSSLK